MAAAWFAETEVPVANGKKIRLSAIQMLSTT
jgi:hypothetical protein